MIEIKKGKKKIKNGSISSIVDVYFEKKYVIHVFQGNLSTYDIIVKYAENNGRLRTPKHVHWAVDLLLKLQAKKELTIDFINEIKKRWDKVEPLINNSFEPLMSYIKSQYDTIDCSKYEELNSYGEYCVEFLIVLMSLLMVQEKTNRSDAYMFGNVLTFLLKDELDIFAIMSAAGFGKR